VGESLGRLILAAISPEAAFEVCAGVSSGKTGIDEASNARLIANKIRNFFTGTKSVTL